MKPEQPSFFSQLGDFSRDKSRILQGIHLAALIGDHDLQAGHLQKVRIDHGSRTQFDIDAIMTGDPLAGKQNLLKKGSAPMQQSIMDELVQVVIKSPGNEENDKTAEEAETDKIGFDKIRAFYQGFIPFVLEYS